MKIRDQTGGIKQGISMKKAKVKTRKHNTETKKQGADLMTHMHSNTQAEEL